MKIIFDSEEQMDKFMDMFSEFCPADYGLKGFGEGECSISPPVCYACWKNCGIEMDIQEVTDENNI